MYERFAASVHEDSGVAAFIMRHPVATYFALTFTISWGGVLLVIFGADGMTSVKAHDNPLFPTTSVTLAPLRQELCQGFPWLRHADSGASAAAQPWPGALGHVDSD
jgi:hypothetical protein